MRNMLIIADLTYREARRRKILWTALGLGAAFIVLYGVGFFFIYRDMAKYDRGQDLTIGGAFNFVVMAGLYVVSFLGVMLAVLTSVGTLSGEIASHTIQSLAVKPLKRSAIVLGKWLGLSFMLAIYISLLGGGVMLATWIISGYMLPNALTGIALIIVQALIMLTLSILGGTWFSTIANGVFAFMLYGLAFIGGWIEQIGSLTHNETAVDIGILSSLLVPSEVMWKLAAYAMQSPIMRALPVSPFSMSSAPSEVMVIYAILYTVAVLGLAIRAFNRRDL